MTHYLPMLLMFLAASSTRRSSSPPPAAAAPSSAVRVSPPKASMPAPKPAAAKPKASPAAAKVTPPKTAEEAAAQAAVNAVIVDAIKRQVDTGVSMAKAQAQPAAAAPRMTIDVPKRSPKDAAEALRDFLRRTRKYGSKKAPVPEVKAAQADMGGLSVDGIVGPKTRARAKALGVTLP